MREGSQLYTSLFFEYNRFWGVWAIIMLVAGTGLASAVGFTRGDVAYTLVIVWAFVGIASKQADTPAVATVAWATAALVVLALATSVIRRVPFVF